MEATRENSKNIMFLDIIHHLAFISKHDISEKEGLALLISDNWQGNGPIRHVETCRDFFFHCKSASRFYLRMET
jgi:hypothetical protein